MPLLSPVGRELIEIYITRQQQLQAQCGHISEMGGFDEVTAYFCYQCGAGVALQEASADGGPVSPTCRPVSEARLRGDFVPTVTGPSEADDFEDVDLQPGPRHFSNSPPCD